MEIASQTLVAQLAQTINKPVEPPAQTLSTGAPDDLAAARFRTLMQAPASEPTPTAVASVAAHNPPTVVSPPTDASLGDRVLNGMQSVSGEFQNIWQSVSNTLASAEPLDTRAMLKLQLQLSQVSVQYELLGKVVGRSTQNIDQLVRIQ